MRYHPQGNDGGGTAAPRIGLGSIVVAKCATGVCDPGELGVCYEVYTLGNRPGYSFIFERGRYDGFSPDEVAAMLEVTGRTCDAVAGYEFHNVQQLCRDYEAGRFAAAFQRTPSEIARKDARGDMHVRLADACWRGAGDSQDPVQDGGRRPRCDALLQPDVRERGLACS